MTSMIVPHCSDLSQPAAIMKRRRVLIFVEAAFAVALLVCNARAQGVSANLCKLTPIGEATVSAVHDGGTLLLADGRETLQTLAAGQKLRLEKLGNDQDRYGRLVGFAFPGESPQSLQAALLAEGRARVSARIGAKTCAEALLTMERAARADRRGLWADPNFAPLQAENLTRLQAERGRFALVEGKVLSVRESGATIYVNFGRRWTEALTVIILKRQQRTFASAGVEPKRLEGRRVRVRGWIEQRGGPTLMAEAPEQIELID